MLLKINRAYNIWRAWRGLEYWSLSRAIKARVKGAVNHVSKFETHIADLARQRGCVGVMCGHIHTPADKMLGDIHYLNSGDWIESLTAVVEHWDGRYELIDYASFLRDHPVLNPPRSQSRNRPMSRWRPRKLPSPLGRCPPRSSNLHPSQFRRILPNLIGAKLLWLPALCF